MLQSNIVLDLNNDEVVHLAITSAGTAWDLTDATVEVVVKPTASTPDSDAAAIHADVTITDPAGGLATAGITAGQLTTAGRWYWHCDVIDAGGDRKTALYGDVLIIPYAAAPVPTGGVSPSGNGAVDSVNGQTGVVVLTASNVGADASGAAAAAQAAAEAASLPVPAGTPSAGQVPVATGIGQRSAWQDPIFLFPTGDTSGAGDAANINAAVTAPGPTVLGPGTYYLNATIGPMITGQWIICAPGVFINWKGTGDCFRWVDTSTYTTRTGSGGGLIGRPVIDGTGSGAGSTGIHAGDILQLHFDVAIQNYTGTGDIAAYFDNQNYWSEQAVATIWTNNCTQDVVFNCGGATTSAGSFDRGKFTIYLSHKTFTGDCVTWRNGAYMVGGLLEVFGNINSSASAFTHSVFTITGSAPGGHPSGASLLSGCLLNINLESDEGLAHTFQTINYGSTANTITNCAGSVNFGGGNQFTGSNITSLSSQFTFVGPVVGDVTLNETTLTGRLAVPSSASFFSDIYIQEIGSPPGTPSGGGYVYVDASGNFHYKSPGGVDTVVAYSASGPAPGVSYKPSNPVGTTSAIGSPVMMGLGSACTFTPQTTGKVRVTICGIWYTSGAAAENGTLGGRYGTGSAPVNGAAASGTRFGTGSVDLPLKTASTGFGMSFSITEIVILTPGTTYWFDLAESTNTGGTTQTGNVVCSIDELAA